jgi:putative tryptophan/tyrosine transport system substrate-binding protein
MRRRDFVIVLLGGAVFSSREGRTQERSIGFLSAGSADAYAPFVAAFRSALNDAGYVEGRNLAIEFRWAEGHYDRLPELAAELVRSKPEVIVTSGGDIVIGAAKAAAAAIPIVFASGGDPVARGFVAGLARPGGSMTGVSLLVIELVPKRLEFVQELVSEAAVIAGLVNPKNSNAGRNVAALQEAARAKGVQLHIVEASSEGDFETAFASLAPLHAGALVVGADPFFNARRSQIVGLAARHSMPAIYEWREFVDAGGLISYGPSLPGVYRQMGAYVGRILGGEKPADLPVVQPTLFELVVNLKTAKTLGLAVPPSILARADEVIE